MTDLLIHPRTILLLGIGLIITLLALRSLRAGRLKERYVLLFVGTGIPFLVFALWPDLIVWAERVFQIEKATLLVLCVATYFILTTFALLSIVSVQDRRITNLGQQVAILAEHPPTAPAAASADMPTRSSQH